MSKILRLWYSQIRNAFYERRITATHFYDFVGFGQWIYGVTFGFELGMLLQKVPVQLGNK